MHARYRANRNPRRSYFIRFVRALLGHYAVLAAVGSFASTRLRSFLCVVSTDHATNLGAAGEEISRSRHDGRVDCAITSALDCHPFVPCMKIGDSLHDAHVAQAVSKFGWGSTRPFDFTAARKSSSTRHSPSNSVGTSTTCNARSPTFPVCKTSAVKSYVRVPALRKFPADHFPSAHYFH